MGGSMLRFLFFAVQWEPIMGVPGDGFRMYQELCKRFESENVDVYNLVNSLAPVRVAGKLLQFPCPIFEPRRLWFYIAILKTIINTYIAILRIKPNIIIDSGQGTLHNIASLALKLTTKIPIVMVFHHWKLVNL